MLIETVATPQIISFTWPAAVAVIASVVAIVTGLSRIFVKNGHQLEVAKLWTETKQHETSIGAINGDLTQIREAQKELDTKLDSRTKDIYDKIDSKVESLGSRMDVKFDTLNSTIIEYLSNR